LILKAFTRTDIIGIVIKYVFSLKPLIYMNESVVAICLIHVHWPLKSDKGNENVIIRI